MGTDWVSHQLSDISNSVPEALIPILITLALSFLIGLEREEHKSGYNFGGVRTFPIIGLCGYLMASLTQEQPIMIGFGVLVLGSLLWLSYRKKLQLSTASGMTSEVSGLFTFLMGALIFHGALWEATTMSVIVLLLLELKVRLEALARKIPPEEIFTFTRFLLISVVMLPMIPNQDFTPFHLNPFYTWLIVVAISGLSYTAYVAGIIFGTRRSIVLTAILGGIYSSTSTTVMLAKRSKEEEAGPLFSGAIIIASGFMYFRLVALLCAFNWNLGRQLALPFLILGSIFAVVGGLSITRKHKEGVSTISKLKPRNPLELQSALLFAALFSGMGILTTLTLQYLGSVGIYALSFLTGLTDVDPFVMSLTQSSGAAIAEQTAAHGIIIATASNNIMKAIYAAIWGAEEVRKQGAFVLVLLAFVSLFALFFV